MFFRVTLLLLLLGASTTSKAQDISLKELIDHYHDDFLGMEKYFSDQGWKFSEKTNLQADLGDSITKPMEKFSWYYQQKRARIKATTGFINQIVYARHSPMLEYQTLDRKVYELWQKQLPSMGAARMGMKTEDNLTTTQYRLNQYYVFIGVLLYNEGLTKVYSIGISEVGPDEPAN